MNHESIQFTTTHWHRLNSDQTYLLAQLLSDLIGRIEDHVGLPTPSCPTGAD